MKTNLAGAFAVALVATAEMAVASPVVAATTLVDFETAPSIATGPSVYVAVPGPQTVSAAPATFAGGVALGFAMFFGKDRLREVEEQIVQDIRVPAA